MKRYIYTLLACACALFGFVVKAEAQIQDGDIITIRSGDNNYLAVDGNSITNVSTTPTVNCLWKVGVNNSQYYFQSVADETKYLRYNNGLVVGNNSNKSMFTFSGTNEGLTATGTLRYSTNRYIRYTGTWTTTNRQNQASSLTLEKWQLKEESGGLQGKFSDEVAAFGLAETDTRETRTVEFTVSRTPSERYYQCLATDKKIILAGGEEDNSPIEFYREVSFRWENGQTTAYASCANYENASVTNRALMQVTWEKDLTKAYTWVATITAIGSSPMEMKDGDKWTDYVNDLIAEFVTDGGYSTHRFSMPVTRRSYHREVLPEFEVEAVSNVEFSRDGGTTALDVICVHQHGYVIRHMWGDVSDNKSDFEKPIETQTREEIKATESFADFEAKSMEDETASDWLTVDGLNDGVLTIHASVNTGTLRQARLVGVFNYTNPSDVTDKHSETIVIHVLQRVKDGKIHFVPNKGHSGRALGTNPYSGAEEQQVHTAEKTIYYTPGAEVELRIAETHFRGYMRWYDYETGCNPPSNKIEADRTSWATAPSATPAFKEINQPTTGNANSYGNSYGLYTANNGGNVTIPEDEPPVLKGWADGKAHVIACDVSSHKDYRISDTTIIEPTLSYRQLFHLRPATEIADKFKKLGEGEFLENYEYTAPNGRVVMLSTQFRYKSFTTPRSSHSSDLCYYYYTNGTDGTLGQVGVTDGATANWYKVNGATLEPVEDPNYPTFDYLRIEGQAADTEVEYQLIVPGVHGGKDLRIARFVVNFVDVADHGPVNSIMSHADIESNYQVLAFNDFSYGTTPTTGSSIEYLNKPLPWGESTYGFFYSPNEFDACDRQNTNIPYYGEYALLNTITPANKSWAGGSQHGGADEGFALFVDGTTEPGLVASISTDAVICSGQTLYCSLWLMNPRKNNQGGTPPIFRCNIQGRHTGDAEWKDVGMYYVGELANNDQNWKQVLFPINSKESYDETRVQIYNFGTGGDGNDFFMDDLCLFVSPLPMAAYQATMGCESFSDEASTSTAVVVRIDYNSLNEDASNGYVYYQIYNNTDDRAVNLKTMQGGVVVPAYHGDDAKNTNPSYGSVKIPEIGYVPSAEKGDVITDKLQQYIEGLVNNQTRHSKCYVKDGSGKWYLYVIHIVPSVQNNEYGEEEDVYLVKDKEYQLVISHDPEELAEPDCAFVTPLYATQDTYLELRSEEGHRERVECMDLVCANNYYFLDVKVQNSFAGSVGGALQTVEALVHADWLVGYDFDDVYCNPLGMTDEDKAAADANFEATYRCTRTALRGAIVRMREVPSVSTPNPNYTVDDAKNLVEVPALQFTKDDIDLIQRLCEEEKLKLYKTTAMFYMGSEEKVRYWAYPVAEDAKVKINGEEHTLYDCDAPKWVKLTAMKSDYAVNLSPIDKNDQTPQQRLDLPSIRLVEGTEEVLIPVNELTDSTTLYSTLAPNGETIKFDYREPKARVLEYVKLTDESIEVVDAPSSLQAGEEYLMRMAFYDKIGQSHLGGNIDSCRVGYVYFYLTIVPKTVQWVGGFSPYWEDDENWKGVKADGTLVAGYVPLNETNVWIKVPEDPSVSYPVVRKVNNHPMDVNYVSNACKNIYIEAGAMIHNQHLLQYEKAFVDMKIEAANWQSMAVPLKGMYTGDMFVPHDTLQIAGVKSTEYTSRADHSEYPFVVKPFAGTRTTKAAYVFWQSLYNKRVSIYHENANQSIPELTNTTVFAQTNSLSQALPVGSGFQVLGFGPKRNSYSNESTEDIIVRLPKPDTKYNYYYKDGSVSDQVAYVEHSSKLAFEPNADGNMPITLTNEIASNQFMFGNPTMDYIDMEKFLKANESVLAQKYYSMENSAWSAENMFTIENNPGTGLLAPMRSVMLELKEGSSASKSLTVTLSTKHLSGAEEGVPASAPRKRMSATAESPTQLMTIYAISEGGQARCVLAANEDSKNSYDSAEDVLFVSSGVETDVNSATATTPVNMYTVSEQVPMMVDVRETIERVPLSLLVHPDYRTAKMQLAFYLSMNWNKECYLHDVKTGERYRILDGLWLELEMPSNHEERYYVEGPDESEQGGGPATELPEVEEVLEGKDVRVWTYSPEEGALQVFTDDVMSAVAVYDVLGRLLTNQKLALHYPTVTLHLPTGACIVEVTLRDNSKRYTQAIVR